MIEINEKFSVPAAPDEVYAVLSDPHAVVECVAGAALGEQNEDGTYDGTMTVKFSALRVNFAGRIALELDEQALWGKVQASGRDGQGGTKFRATAEFTVEAGGGGTSFVAVTGEVALSGKLASVIENAATAVVRRMTAEFVEALSMRCASSSTQLGPTPAAPAVAPSISGAAASPADDTSGPPDPVARTVGILLLHDFGRTPSGVRPWGEAFAAAGMTVSIPRLPGHGTRWKDLHRTGWQDWYAAADHALAELRADHDQVFAMGLGLGGSLALRLAELRADSVAGVTVVNPMFSAPRGTPRALGLMRYLRRSVPAAGSDIRKPDVTDAGYDRTSLRAAHSLAEFGVLVRSGIPAITCPVLVVTSRTDHVVDAADGTAVSAAFAGEPHRRLVLANSYHIATLDEDAPQLFAESVAFVESRVLARRA